MQLTVAESKAVFEALKSIVGSIRAKQLFCEGCDEVVEGKLIGEAHAAPTTRPRSVEPADARPPVVLHPGTKDGAP